MAGDDKRKTAVGWAQSAPAPNGDDGKTQEQPAVAPPEDVQTRPGPAGPPGGQPTSGSSTQSGAYQQGQGGVDSPPAHGQQVVPEPAYGQHAGHPAQDSHGNQQQPYSPHGELPPQDQSHFHGQHGAPPSYQEAPPAGQWAASPQDDPSGQIHVPAERRALTVDDPGSTMDIDTLSGHFFWISLRRAFRLQIKTTEVLRSEKRALEQDAAHVTDPEQQAFLAWRRSVLLIVAILFVPLTVVRLIEAFGDPPLPLAARMFVLLPAIAEAIFCVVAFDQLRNWTKWKKQRRILFIAWAIYFLAPFIVYLYPFRGAFEGSYQLAKEVAAIGDINFRVRRSTVDMAVGLVFGVQSLLALGPKVISLMPGLIRASIVSKLLFPGTTAPGWLMILSAPLYALFAYIIVLLPYQITGSWVYVAGNFSILVAQVFIAWSGRRLTQPLSTEESHQRIHKSWLVYIFMVGLAAGFMIFGLYSFVSALNLGIVRIISGVLTFMANVLLLTLIGTDAIVAGMAHFKRRVQPDPQREKLLRHSEDKLDRFCS